VGKLIGIDLGTTNCVVAVVGKYGIAKYQFGRVSVLTDKLKRPLHASAICECEGELMFAEEAKGLAAEGYAPVRFWKRYMGKDITFDLKGKPCRPQDLSCDLLMYLKGVAQEALGEPVEGAVITHPAYFGGDAIGATRQAGDAAGLNVGADRLMMEPIAAALAYLQSDRDIAKRVRVMVYDLGGGTFDITILQRDSGAFVPVGFGGDPELGGYNFDKALANHMLKELRGQGYRITIDPDKPEKDTRWAKLMHLAEETKVELGKNGPIPPDDPKAEGTVLELRKPRLFKDDDGKAVQLSLTITQRQFEEMIEPHIQHTIDCCEEVLAKAKLGIQDIDRAILVGGSSRLPLVRQRLAQKYGREFEFDTDLVDLSVAIGAALYAGAEKAVVNGFRFETVPPAETSAKELIVAGWVQPTKEVPDPAKCVVTLVQNGVEDLLTTGASAEFYFEQTLKANATHTFTLTAQTAAGQPIASHTFTVVQKPTAEPPPPEPPGINYLAKSLYVETVDRGHALIAEEGMPLPAEIYVDWLVTSGTENPEVNVDLFQDDVHLVTIPLHGFSIPVPEGTPVYVSVKVGKDYTISARAEIPSHNAFTVVEKVPMPKSPRPAVQTLKDKLVDLKKKADQVRLDLPPGERKMQFGTQAEALIDEVETLLKDTEADVYRIQRLLLNLERLTKQYAPGNLDPTRADMAALFGTARQLLPEAEAKDPAMKKQEYGKTLDLLTQQADEAYGRQDQRAWEGIAKRVQDLVKSLEGALSGGGRGDLPPPPDLLLIFVSMVGDLEKQAQANGKIADPRVNAALQKVRADLNGVDVEARDATMRLINIYKGSYTQLELLITGKPPQASVGGLRTKQK